MRTTQKGFRLRLKSDPLEGLEENAWVIFSEAIEHQQTPTGQKVFEKPRCLQGPDYLEVVATVPDDDLNSAKALGRIHFVRALIPAVGKVETYVNCEVLDQESIPQGAP